MAVSLQKLGRRCVVAGACGVAAGTGRASEFHGLGFLDGATTPLSYARDISTDLGTVVGFSDVSGGREAFRYDTASGMLTGLGYLPGGTSVSAATGVSADGSTIVGASDSASSSGYPSSEAFVYDTASATLTGLGFLPGDYVRSQAWDVSADGSLITGHSQTGLIPSRVTQAFVYDRTTGGMTGLGFLPGGSTFSAAYAISADGSTIVGSSNTALSTEAFAYSTHTGIMTGLGDLPGGETYSHAYDVSADGNRITGTSGSALGDEAFIYSVDSAEMLGLGGLLGQSDSSSGVAISGDGLSVVVRAVSAGENEFFLWREGVGIRPLREILEDQGLGPALSGWTFTSVSGINHDGQTLVGNGINPDGNTEAWIATLGETVMLVGDYNDSGQVEQGDLDLVLSNWGVDTDAVGVPAGWEGEQPQGVVDQGELDAVLRHWATTSAPSFRTMAVPEPAAAVVVGLVLCRRRSGPRP